MLSDDFYRALEDRFRGSRETIKARQSVYLPVVEALYAKVPKQVLDVGCGTGRHLLLLGERLRLGVGVDYERSYVAQAQRRGGSAVHFVTGDATAIPLAGDFDLAMCVTNTWGTMSDKGAVLDEMRRLAPSGTRLLSVYSPASVPARREWYRRLGHPVSQETAEYLDTEGGFRSEHFSETRLRALVGNCTIRPLSEIGYVVTF